MAKNPGPIRRHKRKKRKKSMKFRAVRPGDGAYSIGRRLEFTRPKMQFKYTNSQVYSVSWPGMRTLLFERGLWRLASYLEAGYIGEYCLDETSIVVCRKTL